MGTAECTTLRDFLKKIETMYGKARRVWVMDRGIPSEAILKEMREPERQTSYLVGTPKGRIHQHEKKWLDLPWQKVRDSVDVKLYEHEGELYVLAKSSGRQAKENAIRRKRRARLLRRLRVMRKSSPERDHLLLRIGAAKKEAGRAFGFVKIRLPKKRRGSHARDIHVLHGQGEAQGSRAARRTLSAAQQSHWRRPGGAVDPLCAVGADRERIPIAEDWGFGPSIISSNTVPMHMYSSHFLPTACR
jgi:hypothetical protein